MSPPIEQPVLILPDQLSDAIGPLAATAPPRRRILLVESREWLARRPYHRQRLATIMIAMRHFAQEQRRRGASVTLIETDEAIGDALRNEIPSGSDVPVMEPAEFEMRAELAPLVRDGTLRVVVHDGWLTTHAEFRDACPRPPFRMDAFYRRLRKSRDLLMDDAGKPLGGTLSFDSENRHPWRGDPPAPTPPRFDVDAIKRDVAAKIEAQFSEHPGEVDLTAIPGSSEEVDALWSWGQRECMTHFGRYEDAMSVRSRGLFHTRLSAMINLHRLLPQRVLGDLLSLEIPLASQEGFLRQLIGWREFVHHVHLATDGFRTLEGAAARDRPGDGGHQRWSGRAWTPAKRCGAVDGGATPNALEAATPLPLAYWGAPSGLACLDQVVADVWKEGWSHHITRLMVLGNIATLLGVSPRELTDWFWIAYNDSWDWVVEPNVLGMATFAAGELMTTKPYVSGAAYINRMSDHCAGCAFDPKRTCPITRLYWAFLARHEDRFAAHPRMAARMGVVLKALAKRSGDERDRDRREFVRVRDLLINGERVDAALLDRGLG